MKKVFSWPVSITIAILIWCIFFAGFAIYSGNFKSDLVKTDYYEDKNILNIKTLKIKNSLENPVKINKENKNNTIGIKFPEKFIKGKISGNIIFYRPSDKNLDKIIKIKPDINGLQFIDTEILLPGFWRIEIEWKSEGMTFMQKDQIIIR